MSVTSELPLRHRDLALTSAHAEVLAFQLGAWLNQLLADGDTFLTVAMDSTNRFVQFATGDGDYLRAETTGDIFLEPRHQLGPTEHDRLARFGWNPPQADEVFVGNHWKMWTPPDVADAAQLGALTLCTVCGLSDATLADSSVRAGLL